MGNEIMKKPPVIPAAQSDGTRQLTKEPKTSRAVVWCLAILNAAGVGAAAIGFGLGVDTVGPILVGIGLLTLGATATVLIGLLPGYIARGKQRHKDIRTLGLIGIIIPVVWLFAFIWAFVDKPADQLTTAKRP